MHLSVYALKFIFIANNCVRCKGRNPEWPNKSTIACNTPDKAKVTACPHVCEGRIGNESIDRANWPSSDVQELMRQVNLREKTKPPRNKILF